jgi:hypothetical protein
MNSIEGGSEIERAEWADIKMTKLPVSPKRCEGILHSTLTLRANTSKSKPIEGGVPNSA